MSDTNTSTPPSRKSQEHHQLLEASPEYRFGLKITQCSRDENPLVSMVGLPAFFQQLAEDNDEPERQRTRLENFSQAFFPSVADLAGPAPRTRFLAMNSRGLPLWFQSAVSLARESNDAERCTKLRAFFFKFLKAQFAVAKRMGKSAKQMLKWVTGHHSKSGNSFLEAIKAVVSEGTSFEEHVKRMKVLKEDIVAGHHPFLQPVGEPSDYENNSFGQIARLFDLAKVALPRFSVFMNRFAGDLRGGKGKEEEGAEKVLESSLEVIIACIKSEVRTMEKYLNKGCDCRGLTDIVRGRIVCNSIRDITSVVDALMAHAGITIVKLRPHFQKAREKMDGRWADCQLYFTFNRVGSSDEASGASNTINASLSGFIFELQIAHRAFVNRREEVHDHYDYECVRLSDVFMKSLSELETTERERERENT